MICHHLTSPWRILSGIATSMDHIKWKHSKDCYFFSLCNVHFPNPMLFLLYWTLTLILGTLLFMFNDLDKSRPFQWIVFMLLILYFFSLWFIRNQDLQSWFENWRSVQQQQLSIVHMLLKSGNWGCRHIGLNISLTWGCMYLKSDWIHYVVFEVVEQSLLKNFTQQN